MRLNNDYQYTIDKPHAVTKAGNMLYTYDANGNMQTRENTKTKAKMTLVWDNEIRLKQSIDDSYTTDYRYDANGERILKSSDIGELEYVSASYVVRNGTIVSKHIFAGNGRVASTVGNLTDEGKTTTNSVLYYHPDHLGSSSYVTDKQGRFYEAIEYLPYGETLFNERAESDGVSYKYTGLEKDLETGLYAMTHRYYDASIGKFLSVDPILEMYLEGEGNGGVYYSINLGLYSYVSCNPINFSDPSGLLSGKDLDSASMGSWRGFEIDDTGGSKAPSYKVRKESQGATNRGNGVSSESSSGYSETWTAKGGEAYVGFDFRAGESGGTLKVGLTVVQFDSDKGRHFNALYYMIFDESLGLNFDGGVDFVGAVARKTYTSKLSYQAIYQDYKGVCESVGFSCVDGTSMFAFMSLDDDNRPSGWKGLA